MDISEKIRILRNNLGLTLEEVGNYVGVSKSTVRKWETGEIANMRRDKIARLAEVLQTTPEYLMGWSNSPDKNKKPADKISELQMQLFKKIEGFSEDQLQLLLDHAKLIESALRNRSTK